uniref:Uncharacterized protein n=1 Tax=Arundo donax TaxID=35708 RepID=A0A0A9D1R3_ARUDO
MLEECSISDISSRSKRITPSRPTGIKTEPTDFITSMIHEHTKLILSISAVISSLLHRNGVFSSSSTPSSLNTELRHSEESVSSIPCSTSFSLSSSMLFKDERSENKITSLSFGELKSKSNA